MTKHKTILLLAIIAMMILTACGTANTPVDKNANKTVVETPKKESKDADLIEVTPAPEENYQTLLQGRWQNLKDNSLEVVFQDDQRLDYSEGKEVSKASFSISTTCKNQTSEEETNYIIQGDSCWQIASLDEEILSIIEPGPGMAIFYSRVPEKEVKPKEETDKQDKLAIIDSPVKNGKITSPVTITGKAPAFWFFENSFPVQVKDSAGNILGSGQAFPDTENQPEGMTAFHAEVEFEKTAATKGVLQLSADNSSGLPENDYQIKLPVTF